MDLFGTGNEFLLLTVLLAGSTTNKMADSSDKESIGVVLLEKVKEIEKRCKALQDECKGTFVFYCNWLVDDILCKVLYPLKMYLNVEGIIPSMLDGCEFMRENFSRCYIYNT